MFACTLYRRTMGRRRRLLNQGRPKGDLMFACTLYRRTMGGDGTRLSFVQASELKKKRIT